MRILRTYSNFNVASYIGLCEQGVEVSKRILKDILEIREKNGSFETRAIFWRVVL